MKIARVTAAVFALAFLGTFTMAPRQAGANGCKPDGQRCQTNISCCSRNCMKPASPPGKAKPLFGTCCTPTTCTKQGATCGMIPDGDCGDTLNCGTCPAGQSCGTDNVCHCAPNCANKICGDDGCGGSCGTCDMSECDTTTGMCVPCIPDGDQGCRGDFDCCSGVCGAGTVCESTTTTTTTTTTATTTTTMGCTPATSCPLGQNCGTAPDGCGDALDCGTCSPMLMCEQGGIPHCCQPNRGTAAMCNPMLPCCLGGPCKPPGFCCVLDGVICSSSSDCCSGNCVTGPTGMICGPPS